MRPDPRWMLALAATVVLATVGCDEAPTDGWPREPLSGKITLDGRPLEAGTITFFPVDFEGPAAAVEFKDGAYSIERADGPIPGIHRVAIYSSKPTGRMIRDAVDQDRLIEETYETLPGQYNSNTQLRVEVTKGGDNTFDFPLEGELKKP